MRSLVTLALSLVVSTALAAHVNLGQETPVGDPAFGNAALAQQAASVASNGRDYLAVWNDGRPATGSELALYVSRVDAGGHPVEPSGHKLVDGALGKVLWTGTSYVLLYSVGGISFEQFLGDDGYPISPAIHLSLGGTSFSAGTNGDHLLTVDVTGEVFLIDFNGGVFRQHIGHQLAGASPIAAVPGGDFFFAALENDCGASQCAQRIALEQVDHVAAVVTRHPLLDVNLGTMMNGAASDDGRMLVAWNDPVADQLSVRYEIVDATGHMVAGPALLPNSTSGYDLSVGFDGRDFLVAYAQQSWRIAANGQLLGHGTADAGLLLFAHSTSGVLEARTASNGTDDDALVRAAPSFAQLGAAPERSVAMSSRLQREPRLAASAAGFVAWFEKNASLMAQPLGGAVTHVADVVPWDLYFPPVLAVARGGSGYLAVWQALADDRVVLHAKRLALDGTPLDAEPIPFAASDQFELDAHPISIAFDGTNFLVVWPALLGAVHGVRISQSGMLLDDAPLVIAPADDHFAMSPRLVWNGKNYVLAWLDLASCLCAISPAPPPHVSVFAIRVGRDGQPLDSKPAVLSQISSVISSLALATDGADAALVWTGAGCVYASTLRADGTPAGNPRALTCRTLPSVYANTFDNAGVAWSGSEYVAIWSDPNARVIHAARFDRAAAPIDDFDVSPSGFGASQPDIAATANGVTIGYVRLAPEAQFGGAPRIFVRSLERLEPAPAPPPRRRASH